MTAVTLSLADKLKTGFLLLFLCMSASTAAAQNLQTDSLTSSNVEATFHETSSPQGQVTFEWNGGDIRQKKNLTYRQLFLPSRINSSEYINTFDVQVNQITRSDRNNTLGRRLTLNFNRQTHLPEGYSFPGGTGCVLGYGCGDNWKTDRADVSFKVENPKEQVFNGELESGIGSSSGTIDIDVDSNNENLVVRYTVFYGNGSVAWSGEDIFEGEEPEKVPFTVEVKEDGERIIQNVTYDNRGDKDPDYEVFEMVFPEQASVLSTDFSGMMHTEISTNYSWTKKELQQAQISESLIKDDLQGYKVRSFNVTIPADSRKTVKVEFNDSKRIYGSSNADSLTVDKNSMEYYSYIVGSGGALEVTSSATYCGDVTDGSGNLYSTILIDGTVDVCDYDGTTGSGTVNFTATKWVNVTSNGEINAVGAGYNGGNGGSFSNNGECVDSENGESGESGNGPLPGSGGGWTVDCADLLAQGNSGKAASINLNATNYQYGIGSGGGGGGVADISNDDTFYGGDGGAGGGAVYIDSTNEIVVNGVINATGHSGHDASIDQVVGIDGSYALGGGSGGAAGSIVLNTSILDISGSVLAEGGSGGDKIVGGNNGYSYDGAGSDGGYIKLFYKEAFRNSSITKSVSAGESDYSTGSSGSYHVERNEAVPGLSIPTYIEDRKNGLKKLKFKIDDFKETDIASATGISNPSTFTNETLRADIQPPFSSTVSVTDFPGFTSETRSVDLSTTDSGLVQHQPFSSTVSEQRVNQSIEICNLASSEKLNYSLEMKNRGTIVTSESWNGQINSDSCVEKTGVWSNDWIQENQFQKKFLNGSSIVVDQEEWVKFNRSWTHTSSSPAKLNISLDFTTEYSNSVWSSNSTPTPKVMSTPGSSVWKTVSLHGTPLPNAGTDNGARCPSGFTDFGSYCKRQLNIDNSTEYTYIKFVKPETNLTENQAIDTVFDDAVLSDWSKRANLTYSINDRSTGVNLSTSTDGAVVRATNNYGNSSFHEGKLYNVSFSYDNSGGTDDQTGTGSGGGVFDDDFSVADGNQTGRSSQGYALMFEDTTFAGPPGENLSIQDAYFSINNYVNARNNVTLTIPETSQCRYFKVQRQKGIGLQESLEPSKTGYYQVPGSSEAIGNSYSLNVFAQVQVPSQQVLENNGGSISCTATVNSSYGNEEQLVLKVEKDTSWFTAVVSFFESLSIPDSDVAVIDDVCVDGAETGSSSGCSEGERFSFEMNPAQAAAATILFLLIGVPGLALLIGLILYLRNLLPRII